MFIAQSRPNLVGAVRRSGTQAYGYPPSSFRSSERRIVFVVLGSINISLLRSEDLPTLGRDAEWVSKETTNGKA